MIKMGKSIRHKWVKLISSLFQLQKENYDFYPLDRALSLAAMGQDSTETKIDDLLFQVTTIVEKQKFEV